MGSAFQLREGTSTRFEAAKALGTLQPKSLYLVDGVPHLALTNTTTFAFADTAAVSRMIAGLGTGGDFSLGDAPGKAPTSGGTPGTSQRAAREDHTHPAQTSITGNAHTATTAQSATRLAAPRTIRLSGAVTGHAEFSGESDCRINTTLASNATGPAFWVGTQDELPALRDENTVYFVTEP